MARLGVCNAKQMCCGRILVFSARQSLAYVRDVIVHGFDVVVPAVSHDTRLMQQVGHLPVHAADLPHLRLQLAELNAARHLVGGV